MTFALARCSYQELIIRPFNEVVLCKGTDNAGYMLFDAIRKDQSPLTLAGIEEVST